MWFKRFDSSELTADVVAALKRDGLTVHDSAPGDDLVTVTTDSDWLANKWEMSEQTSPDCPKDTYLDRLAKIGALNFIVLFVLAVLGVAWLLWRNRR
jgi:hypothetical protein